MAYVVYARLHRPRIVVISGLVYVVYSAHPWGRWEIRPQLSQVEAGLQYSGLVGLVRSVLGDTPG